MDTLPLKQIDEGVYVGGQIGADDIADLVRFGIAALICNRPDGEAAGQPDFATIKQAAEAHGIVAHYVPVISGAMTADNVSDMAAVLQQSPRPLLIYCRSGSRSKHLYGLASEAARLL